MKIAILVLDHIYANKVVKDLIEEFDKEIVLIIESKVLIPKKSQFVSLLKYLRVSSVDYVVNQIIKFQLYKLLSFIYILAFPKSTLGKFYSYKKVAQKNHIKLGETKDINSKDSIETLMKYDPDLLVSVFFNQILKPRTLKIPKFGCINIHPAYLPNYKGISPVFWSLARGQKYSGVSIHFMDENVDTGKIIKRAKIKINKNDSEDSLYWKCVKIGSPLLILAIKNIRSGKAKLLENKGGTYFSLPTKQATNLFRKRKRKYFRLKEFLFSL